MMVVTLLAVLLLPLLLLRLLDLIQVPIIHILYPYYLPKDTHESSQSQNLSQGNRKSLLKMAD